MLDRLDDIQTLREDFASILDPVIRISEELPRASMRIAELESAVAQERTSLNVVRQEKLDLFGRASNLQDELNAVAARAEKAEAEGLLIRAETDDLRALLRDRSQAMENLERQLFAETEQNKALAGEAKALRAEAQAADIALSRSEHELLAAREQFAIMGQDNRRLQSLSEEQSVQLTELGTHFKELETASEADRQRMRDLETRLATEIAARERAEDQYETETAAFRTERAGITMKLEAATMRATSLDQTLTQARNQLREKDEAHRSADRAFKEATIARSTSERRLEALQADLSRQNERFLELQRLRAELDGRCDMLTKALAAKESALEQASARHVALTDRLDQVTMRHDRALGELETANRRLTEDLEKERSERALAQGALNIARESRLALQKQHEALKRSGRGWREAQPREGEGEGEQPQSNVHLFEQPGRSV